MVLVLLVSITGLVGLVLFEPSVSKLRVGGSVRRVSGGGSVGWVSGVSGNAPGILKRNGESVRTGLRESSSSILGRESEQAGGRRIARRTPDVYLSGCLIPRQKNWPSLPSVLTEA